MSIANVYRQTSVNTASPGNLLIMLFDGLIRFIRQGQTAIQEGNVEGANKALCRSQDIVLELRETLNQEIAPELGNSLYELYSYFYCVLVDANRQKNANALNDILPQIQELRDAFAEAERIVLQERQTTTEG